MRFTVITPTYNRAHRIQAAIESVLAQTCDDFEYLIVDDGSTDETAAVVARYRDPRIRLVRHHANAGQSAACNTGMREARGDIIAFLDSDDTWFPDYLARMSEALDRNADAGFAYGRVVGRMSSTLSSSSTYADVLTQGFLSCPTTLCVRTTLLCAVDGFSTAYAICNDDDLCFRLARRSSFVHVPDALAVAMPDAGSMTVNAPAFARGWDQLFTEYATEIVQHCGHLVLASHRFMVADLYASNGEVGEAIGQARQGMVSLLRRPRGIQPFKRRDLVGIPTRLVRKLTVAVRRRLLGGRRGTA